MLLSYVCDNSTDEVVFMWWLPFSNSSPWTFTSFLACLPPWVLFLLSFINALSHQLPLQFSIEFQFTKGRIFFTNHQTIFAIFVWCQLCCGIGILDYQNWNLNVSQSLKCACVAGNAFFLVGHRVLDMRRSNGCLFRKNRRWVGASISCSGVRNDLPSIEQLSDARVIYSVAASMGHNQVYIPTLDLCWKGSTRSSTLCDVYGLFGGEKIIQKGDNTDNNELSFIWLEKIGRTLISFSLEFNFKFQTFSFSGIESKSIFG